jgi:hypothetical protein
VFVLNVRPQWFRPAGRVSLRGLTEDLGQAHNRHSADAMIGQHLPRPDRRQLVDSPTSSNAARFVKARSKARIRYWRTANHTSDWTFNLTPRALAFAKIRAANPSLSVRECAERVGYAKAGAAVGGFELLRDERVVRAIFHFSALAFAKAAGELSERMKASCKPRPSR